MKMTVRWFSGLFLSASLLFMGGCGDAPNKVAAPKVAAPTPKYAYVANVDSNNVSQYHIGADGTSPP